MRNARASHGRGGAGTMDGETPRRSGKSGRQEQIIADLRLYPAMRVGELAERLGVSSETIRRDLAELDERGLINRTYGGAMRPVVYEPGLAEREGLMVPERQRIAAAAVAGIEANDILMIVPILAARLDGNLLLAAIVAGIVFRRGLAAFCADH